MSTAEIQTVTQKLGKNRRSGMTESTQPTLPSESETRIFVPSKLKRIKLYFYVIFSTLGFVLWPICYFILECLKPAFLVEHFEADALSLTKNLEFVFVILFGVSGARVFGFKAATVSVTINAMSITYRNLFTVIEVPFSDAFQIKLNRAYFPWYVVSLVIEHRGRKFGCLNEEFSSKQVEDMYELILKRKPLLVSVKPRNLKVMQ